MTRKGMVALGLDPRHGCLWRRGHRDLNGHGAGCLTARRTGPDGLGAGLPAPVCLACWRAIGSAAYSYSLPRSVSELSSACCHGWEFRWRYAWWWDTAADRCTMRGLIFYVLVMYLILLATDTFLAVRRLATFTDQPKAPRSIKGGLGHGRSTSRSSGSRTFVRACARTRHYFELPKPLGKVEIPQPFKLAEPIFPANPAAHLEAFDFQITKFMVLQLIVAVLLLLIFVPFAWRVSKGDRARGRIANLLEAMLLFIRDEVARPSIGKHDADRFLPFLWTIFFFVLGCNLLGLVPWAGSATGALACTGALALCVRSRLSWVPA